MVAVTMFTSPYEVFTCVMVRLQQPSKVIEQLVVYTVSI